MSPGEWIAAVSVLAAVVVAVVGGVIRWQANQITEAKRERDDARRERDTQRASYEAKLEIAEQALETKSETVDELRRQVDRYLITAEIQDRFFKQIPPPPSTSGER